MDTSGPSGLRKSRCVKAVQALDLFQNLNDSKNDDLSDGDLEFDGSDGDSDDGKGNESVLGSVFGLLWYQIVTCFFVKIGYTKPL